MKGTEFHWLREGHDMYGHRARLGLVVPSNNTTVEPEAAALTPDGVESFASRVMVYEAEDRAQKTRTILGMHSGLEEAVQQVASLQPVAIAYACTSGSFLEGEDSDREICARLSAVAGIPVITTSTAVVVALRTFGANRIALATPYISEVSAGARRYLEEAGFTVVAHRDLDLLSNLEKGRLGHEASEQLVRAMDLRDADAVFISCTNWRTLESVAALEPDLDIPVISSNLATMWLLFALAMVTGIPRHPARLLDIEPVAIPEFVLP